MKKNFLKKIFKKNKKTKSKKTSVKRAKTKRKFKEQESILDDEGYSMPKCRANLLIYTIQFKHGYELVAPLMLN
jgi:hypothetical protein